MSALGQEHFVSLTTYRRSGEPVATPVWIVDDGSRLVVTTPRTSGKVKRLRRNPAVSMVPCDRRGRVRADAVATTGVAEFVTNSAERDRLERLFPAKYRFEYYVFMAIERVARRGQDRGRELLVITLGPSAAPV